VLLWTIVDCQQCTVEVQLSVIIKLILAYYHVLTKIVFVCMIKQLWCIAAGHHEVWAVSVHTEDDQWTSCCGVLEDHVQLLCYGKEFAERSWCELRSRRNWPTQWHWQTSGHICQNYKCKNCKLFFNKLTTVEIGSKLHIVLVSCWHYYGINIFACMIIIINII